MSRNWSLAGAIILSVGALLMWANYPDAPLPGDTRADLVIIEKSERQLRLYSRGEILKTYIVSLGRVAGRKEMEGDKKTPEGSYVIDSRKKDSAYYRALHISYPTRAEVEAAKARGVAPGGAIMIHGLRNGLGWLGKIHRLANWTLGCVAVTDQEIDELWRAVPDGTKVEILP